MKNPVQITLNYRLSADSLQYVLQRRALIDPRKAPGYKLPETGLEPPVREEWRDDGYYPLTAAGLTGALTAAVLRDITAETSAITITELIAEYRAELDRLSKLVSTVISPQISDVEASGVLAEG